MTNYPGLFLYSWALVVRGIDECHIFAIIYATMKECIVIDTNVLICALRSKRGASFVLLRMAGKGNFDIALSVPLILEYEDVTSREYLALNRDLIDDVLDYLCEISRKRQVFFLWRPLLKDIKDDHVLELAVESSSTSIITFNKRDYSEAAQFGIRLETPLEFLKRMELL